MNVASIFSRMIAFTRDDSQYFAECWLYIIKHNALGRVSHTGLCAIFNYNSARFLQNIYDRHPTGYILSLNSDHESTFASIIMYAMPCYN